MGANNEMDVAGYRLDVAVISGLYQRFGEKRFGVLRDISLRSLPELLDKIGQAYAEQNSIEMRLHVHSIKGSVANYGAVGLADLARTLELKYGAGDIQHAKEEIDRLRMAVQGFCNYLAAYSEEPSPT